MKKILLFTGLGICLTMNGQIEMSVFTSTGRAGASTTFVTDYQSTGINPANLGWKPRWEDKKITFSLLEGAYSLYSQPLTKPEVREAFTSILGGNNSQKFSWEKKGSTCPSFYRCNQRLQCGYYGSWLLHSNRQAGWICHQCQRQSANVFCFK